MSPRPLLALAFVLGALGGCFLSPNVPPSFRYNCTADTDCRVLTCLGDLVAVSTAEARGMMLAEDCDKIPDSEQSLYYEARQTCMGGLCEYPCEVSADACPASKGYNFCLNGACATACANDLERYPDPDATCSDPQRCLIFGEDIELDLIKQLLGGSGGGGGGGGGGNSGFPGAGGSGGSGSNTLEALAGTGLCGVRCDAADALPCPPGQYCSGAMCLPDCARDDATPCGADQKCFPVGAFSICLDQCDPNDPATCDEGEICVMGLNVCQPTCVGENATVCDEGTVCDETLGICIPEEFDTGTDPGTDTDTGTT